MVRIITDSAADFEPLEISLQCSLQGECEFDKENFLQPSYYAGLASKNISALAKAD